MSLSVASFFLKNPHLSDFLLIFREEKEREKEESVRSINVRETYRLVTFCTGPDPAVEIEPETQELTGPGIEPETDWYTGGARPEPGRPGR